MKTKRIYFLFTFLLLASCSTIQMNLIPESYIYEKNYQFTNSLENKFRQPSSIEDAPSITEQNEIEFLKLLHSKNIEQFHLRLQLRLDAIEEVYFRAKASLNDFDEQLNESFLKKESAEVFFTNIIASGAYSRILALRENNLTRKDQMIYFIKRFNEIKNDPSNAAIEIKYAQDAFEFIGSYYKTLPMQYLVAHHQIALELNDLNINSHNWNLGIKRTLGKKFNLDDRLEDIIAKFQESYDTSEVKTKIEIISRSLNTTKTNLGDEITKSAHMIQFGLINSENPRTPQSIKIEPSIGANGNITGNTFPSGVWAVTFDDGPHPKYTYEIASNLKELQLKSTFFSLSKNVEQYPEITRGLKNQGMEIANHSHDHPQLPKLNETQLDFQILTSTEKISSVIHEKPKFFRCPYGAGANVQKVRSRIAKEDMIHVFWNIDSLDWQDHNPASIVTRVKKQAELLKNGGGIILFHDIHPQSVIASKEIMKYLKSGGPNPGKPTEVKTIGEIVDQLNN